MSDWLTNRTSAGAASVAFALTSVENTGSLKVGSSENDDSAPALLLSYEVDACDRADVSDWVDTAPPTADC